MDPATAPAAAPTKNRFVISGIRPSVTATSSDVASLKDEASQGAGMAKSSTSREIDSGRKSPTDKSLQPLSELEAVDVLVTLGLESEAAEASDTLSKIFTASDKDIVRRNSSKASAHENGGALVVGDALEGMDGLMLLAQCIPPGPAMEMSDGERLARLQSLLRSVGLSPSLVSKWAIARTKSNFPVYLTDSGTKLRTNRDVSARLGFSEAGSKLAELMDYLEDRNIAFDPAEWRAEERRRPDGKRTGFCFTFAPHNRTFYARNKVAEYLEAKHVAPWRNPKLQSRKKKEHAVPLDGGAAPGATAATASDIAVVPSSGNEEKSLKKRKRRYKVGDTVRVDYEGVVYDAIIVDTPAGMPAVDAEDGEQLLSVFYLTDYCFEHGVGRSRFRGHRSATTRDEDVFEKYEKGELQADAKESATPRMSKAPKPTKNKRDREVREDGPKSKHGRSAKVNKTTSEEKSTAVNDALQETDGEVIEEEYISPREMRKRMKLDDFARLVDDDPDMAAVDELSRNQLFLDAVKERIGSTKPNLYRTLLGTMQEFRQSTVSLEKMIGFIVDAFGDDDTDLVRKFNIFLPPPLKITPKLLRQRWLSARESEPDDDNPLVQPPSRTYEDFIELVRSRFKHNQAAIGHFREMMAQFELDDHLDTLCREAEHLFTGHPDLIASFNQYLPETHRIKPS